jgi:hypothetical protein
MSNNPTVEQWLEKQSPDQKKIILALMDAARKNMPGANEHIYHDAVGYSINDSSFDRICYIAPQKKGYVNFGFFFGAGLPDSKKLLIGDSKRMRHVKVWSVEEAKNPALAKLIADTWKEAPARIAEVHAGMRKSKV